MENNQATALQSSDESSTSDDADLFPDLLDPVADWPVSSARPYPESASHLLPPSTSWEDRFESLGHQGPYELELGTDVEVVLQVGKTKVSGKTGLRLECVRLPAGAVVVSSFGTTKTLLEGGLYKARYPVAGRLDPRWDLADPVRIFIRRQGTGNPAPVVPGARMPKAQFRLPDGFHLVSPNGLVQNLHSEGFGYGIPPGIEGEYTFYMPGGGHNEVAHRRGNLGRATLFRATFGEAMNVYRENIVLTARKGLYELGTTAADLIVVRDNFGQHPPRPEMNLPSTELSYP
ncbi:hypothetical protein F4820DRAFT_465135 [Hypoxylon rubiginosum]|uniref:Uncharacterized protein n=1 Tax=Hypoxylon rubiginosum TaxID=110542 RepID=A0ACB9YNW0_9PEZI|nr:hypothetical protein F4820DRAFT_465135 [Hypoxylon rubiginosum]